VNTEPLRSFLAAKLPEYMVPWAFVALDDMPLTSNGKVDRTALPTPNLGAGSERTHVAPRSPTEQAVALIFEQLLGVHPISADDDFFLLGGHSLLSVQLCSMIHSRLGVALPLATMFTTRTVEAIAGAIDGRATVATSHLVPMRRGGSRVPLVMVHAIGGTVFSYLDLVARLAPGRPCYAIQAKGVTEGETPAETLEGMARQYVELLHGELGGQPCHLLGWSFGGIVAIEMARQLAGARKQVASITLLDSFAPQRRPDKLDPLVSLEMFARDLGLDLERKQLIGMDREQAFAHVVARAANASMLPGDIGAAELSRFLRVFEANIVAEGHYEAEPLGADVTLITASEPVRSDPSHGLRPLVAGTLTIRETPGDHYSILRPPAVDSLARTLDELLSATETRQR
jgi:thioesterase domain-containing protein